MAKPTELLPGETLLLNESRHLLVLVGRSLSLVSVLVLVILLLLLFGGNPPGLFGFGHFVHDARWLAVLVLALLIFLYLDYQYIRWRRETYTITNQRIIWRLGVISRFSRAVGIDRVQDVTTAQGLLGRLFKYGTVVVDSAGREGQLILSYVPDPNHFRNVIYQRVNEPDDLGQPEPDRILATVMFSDIVGSTERAAGMGDSKWKKLLDTHDATVKTIVAQYRGRLVKQTGDGFLATFERPNRAIRAADHLRTALQAQGIDIRTGLHTGEIELRGDDIGGIAVHTAARVMAEAGPGEIMVSSNVSGLVAGSGIEFEDRGERLLKGLPSEWRLLTVNKIED